MIYLSLLFWLLMALPGYAVVLRIDRDQQQSGLLGTICLSYLGTLALLSPVSIACYLLELPLAVFSGACVLLVVLAAIEVSRASAWRELGRLIGAAVGVELLVVIGDMVLSARTGSIMGADAITHLARIRLLIDHGMTNVDPYVAGDYFFPLYHTNILHALCAAASQLTGVPYLGVWFAALPWAKLLTAAGSYYLAWSVFRSRWAAWVAALFVVGMQGPVTFIIYPNKLAPFWLLATTAGLVIQACRTPSWTSVAWIGAAALVVGQVHALYGGFALLLAGPVLGVVLVLTLLARRPGAWRLAACCLALTLSLPFAWASHVGRAGSPDPTQGRSDDVDWAEGRFHLTEQGWLFKVPFDGFGSGRGIRYWWVAGGCLCGLMGVRRRDVGALVGMLVVAALVFYVPPLCTAAIRVLGAKWVLLRLEIIFFLAFPTLVPGTAAFFCQRWNPPERLRSAAAVLAVVAALPFASHQWPYNWDRYLTLAAMPQERRLGELSKLSEFRRFLQESLSPGETVLVEPHLGMVLVAVYDCRLVAPKRASVGVPRCELRRDHTLTMLWGHDDQIRQNLLESYAVRYLFARILPQWASDRVRPLGTSAYGSLWALEDATVEAEGQLPTVEPPCPDAGE